MPGNTESSATTLNPHDSGSILIMGSMMAASVRHYALMLHFGNVIIDPHERRLPLRHSHHRYRIDSPNGAITMTVPVVGSTNAMPVEMKDVKISEHDDWRARHWGALFSSYGRTPYFDYLADDLHQILIDNPLDSLLGMNMALHKAIVGFMDLPISTTLLDSTAPNHDCLNLSGKLDVKKYRNPAIDDVPYYQIWQERHGFIPDLSIIDLACNMGREGIKVLMAMAKTLNFV